MTGLYNRPREWPSPDRCRGNQQDNKKGARQTEVAEPGCRRRIEWDALLDRSGYETFSHSFRQAPIAMVERVRQNQACIYPGHLLYSVSARDTLKRMLVKFNQLGFSQLIAGR